MNENTLNSFLGELERINNKITNEIENRSIREIQRDELELLYKILQQLKIEESSNDLSWEKSNIFYSISLLHYNIRFYPTLLGLRSPLIMIEKAICEKGVLTPAQLKEAEIFKIDVLIKEINILFNLVNGE
ncbi:hypothetical protein [Legionella sainthelensi]|uniref:Uncharacterized protein n=1 Tax=Legionella sainthelensi TaxID=28087 RepID=A0A2H5FQH7_9GAMM|nr:hypothetical protein [Legionella sainthelensi]AUH73815.1 hypothetical protein CAB17_18525 [Legionella sainthelensi]